VTDKQLVRLLSPVEKLAQLSEKTEEKVDMIYELTVEALKRSETYASEMKQQTSLLRQIRDALKGKKTTRPADSKKKGKEEGGKGKAVTYAGLGKLTAADVGIAAIAMVGIAAAIVAAAGIFSFIPIVKPLQLLTAIAISVAFVPMAMAFTRIAKVLKGIKTKGNVNVAGMKFGATGTGLIGPMLSLAGAALISMVGMSAAVTASSWIMQLIVPISPAQAATAFFIGLSMVGLAYGYAMVVKALATVKGKGRRAKFNPTDMWTAVGGALVSMIGMAAAVTVSSWIMQLIVPISPAQAATAFFIGLAMVGLAYGYAQVVKALASVKGRGRRAKFNPKDMWMVIGGALVSMIGMAAAVTVSSWIMQLIMPVSLAKIGTAFFIGIAFVGLAFGYSMIMKTLKNTKGGKKGGKFNPKDMFTVIGGALLSVIGMAAAVTVSSWIMQLIMPVDGGKLETAFLISLVMIPAAAAFWLISKAIKGMKIKDMLMTAAGIPLIAIGLTAAAWVFNYLPPDMRAPDYDWTLKTGAAIGIFGLAFVALTYTVAKLPLKDMIFGVIGVAAIAVAILATAWIFSILPDSFLAPPMDFTLSAAVALIGFGIVVGIIGALIMMSGGTGLAAIVLGVIGMIIIAAGILAVSWILSYIPAGKLAQVAAGLTDALLTPVNGIVDILKRLKEEIGIDNLVPLAGGILAISAALIALAGATVGVAAAGLGSAIADTATAFFEKLSGKKTKGPLEILALMISYGPKLGSLAENMKLLSSSFLSVSRYLSFDNIKRMEKGAKALVLSDLQMMTMNGFTVKDYFRKFPRFLDDVAEGYMNIAEAQGAMDGQILEKTTNLVKALAYLNEVGGDNAMAKLGDALINAVQELAAMIGQFSGSVDAQTEAGKKSASELSKATANLNKSRGGGGGSSSAGGTVDVDIEPVVDAIEELQRIVRRNNGF
jgi:hypothetical protein